MWVLVLCLLTRTKAFLEEVETRLLVGDIVSEAARIFQLILKELEELKYEEGVETILFVPRYYRVWVDYETVPTRYISLYSFVTSDIKDVELRNALEKLGNKLDDLARQNISEQLIKYARPVLDIALNLDSDTYAIHVAAQDGTARSDNYFEYIAFVKLEDDKLHMLTLNWDTLSYELTINEKTDIPLKPAEKAVKTIVGTMIEEFLSLQELSPEPRDLEILAEIKDRVYNQIKIEPVKLI